MNIVYLAHFAGSPEHGMVHAYYHLAREWLKLGHEVTIVAASFTHPRSMQPEVQKQITEQWIDGIRYLWVKTPAYVPENYIGRGRNIFAFVRRIWFDKLPVEKADVVICSSHHPFAIFPAKRLARKFNARLVFEVRDLWPLSLIELGNLSSWHPFIWLMQRAENYAYRKADHVVSVLGGSDTYMQSHGLNADKYSYIPNGYAITEMSEHVEALPAVVADKLEDIRRQGGFILGYAGGINAGNALRNAITAIAQVRLQVPVPVCFCVLGDGPNLSALKAYAVSLGLQKQVLFLGRVSKAAVQSFLAITDATFIGFQKKRFYQYGVSPTKLNDYMYAAKPVIYAIDAPNDPVAESGCGISCRAENVEDITNAIKKMAVLSVAERDEMGQSGYKWLVENRDYKILAKRFIDEVFT